MGSSSWSGKTESIEDESGSEEYASESEEELELNFPNLSLKDGTERYVITMDGVPQCYTTTLKEARGRMWDMARMRKFLERDYNSYIRESPNENNVQVVGYHRFYVLSYERVLYHLRVHHIQEVEEKPPQEIEEADEIEQEKQEGPKSTGLLASFLG